MKRNRDEIRSSANMLDTRQVEARIDYLTEEREDLLGERLDRIGELADAKDAWEADGDNAGEPFPDQDELDELRAAEDASWLDRQGWGGQGELDWLTELKNGLEDCCEWADGEAIVNDDYFKRYAEELAEECGDIDRETKNRWPFTCIDWEKAADDLKLDCSSTEAGGSTWYVRNS